jgi:hypothetical protein
MMGLSCSALALVEEAVIPILRNQREPGVDPTLMKLMMCERCFTHYSAALLRKIDVRAKNS